MTTAAAAATRAEAVVVGVAAVGVVVGGMVAVGAAEEMAADARLCRKVGQP